MTVTPNYGFFWPDKTRTMNFTRNFIKYRIIESCKFVFIFVNIKYLFKTNVILCPDIFVSRAKLSLVMRMHTSCIELELV